MKEKIKTEQSIGNWEVDIVDEPMFGVPQPNGKSFEMVVIAHPESNFIISTRVFGMNTDIRKVLCETIEEAITKGPLLPGTVIVKKQEYIPMLEKLSKKHNFRIDTSKRLKAVEFFVRSASQWRSDKEFIKTLGL